MGRTHAAFALGLSLALSACTPRELPPLPPPPLPTPQFSEEEVKPLERVQLMIADLNEVPSPDRKTVTLSGTLLNEGNRTTRQVYIHIEALNRDGAVVMSSDSAPNSEVIPAGGRGAFTVSFENRPEIDHYHVEAIAR